MSRMSDLAIVLEERYERRSLRARLAAAIRRRLHRRISPEEQERITAAWYAAGCPPWE